MNITPVLNASVVIQLHLLAALLALGLGAVQLAAAKGTASHRRLGYLWAGMMAVVAISSFFVFEVASGARSAPFICSACLRW